MYSFRVRELRESCGYTQHDLSVKYNIQLSTLRNIEKNRVNSVSTDILFKLKKAFNLDSLDDLFDIK